MLLLFRQYNGLSLANGAASAKKIALAIDLGDDKNDHL